MDNASEACQIEVLGLVTVVKKGREFRPFAHWNYIGRACNYIDTCNNTHKTCALGSAHLEWTTAVKDSKHSSNRAIGHSGNRATRQSGNQAIEHSGKQAVRPPAVRQPKQNPSLIETVHIYIYTYIYREREKEIDIWLGS